MTSLTGGEMRDNCIDEIFYPRPYKCGVLPHLAQPTFALLPLFISAATKASNLKLLYNLYSETSMPKQLFGPKLAGVWAKGAPPKNRTPTYFYNNLSYGLQICYITWGHGEVLPKTTFRTKIGGVWAKEHLNNFGTRTYFYNRRR